MVLLTKDPDIILRKFVTDDVEHLASIANNKKIWLNVRDQFPHPYNRTDAVAFINRVSSLEPTCVVSIIMKKAAFQ